MQHRDPLNQSRPNEQWQVAIRPPQFGLASLMGAMTLLAILFSAAKLLYPLAFFCLLLLCMTLFAHVAGNALGTRLRTIGNQSQDDPNHPIASRLKNKPVAADEFAPAPKLSYRASLGRSMCFCTLSGAALGAVFGGCFLTWENWQLVTIPRILIAATASSVLGGFAGFLASSFLQVAFSTLTDSTTSHKPTN